MADNKKISEFSGKSTLAGSEKFAVASEGANYSITAADLRTYMQDGVVHEVAGKGLSANDYTTEEKRKLSALPTNATLSADIAVAKRQVFVDMWNSACGIYGKYNADTGYFELNGLVDITYKEAVLIYANRRHLSLDNHGFYSSSTARTNLLPSTQNGLFGYTRSLEYSFSSCKNMEVIRLAPNTLTVYSSMVRTFHTCVKLRKILGAINVLQKPNLTEAFALCPLLEEVQIKGLTKDLSFSDSPLLSLDSLSYLVAQSAASNPITVTVHPDVYAKLTGDTSNAAVQALTVEELAQWQALVATAQQKKISFATTTNS